MSKHIFDKILNKPIESLIISRKKPPSIEALRLYRDVLKFSSHYYWNN